MIDVAKSFTLITQRDRNNFKLTTFPRFNNHYREFGNGKFVSENLLMVFTNFNIILLVNIGIATKQKMFPSQRFI